MRLLAYRSLCFAVIVALLSGYTCISVQASTDPKQSMQIAISPSPMVAIHVSELTEALASMPADSPTPNGPGTTGYQWWQTSWTYSAIIGAVEEVFRSDGIPFEVVTDGEIEAGELRQADGTPRYPIVVSLAAEATTDGIANQFNAFVNAGGFLFLGSSALTRYPNGSSRGNFALSTEMGLNSATTGLDNWTVNSTFTRQVSHRLVSHIPTGTLLWSIPPSAEEELFDIRPHSVWRVTTNGADVLAVGDAGPLLTTHSFGDGQVIYLSQLQPLLGHGGYDNGMYSYLIFRNAIEWAFESLEVPLWRLSAWPYPYDAAFNMRHDFENFPSMITSIENSAQYEQSIGVKGDYYFTTGVLRANSEDQQLTEQQKASAVESLRRAVSQYGATIGSHNGGLPNPINPALPSSYSYWHWGPDEVLDSTPAGYASGQDYAYTSLQQSFVDIEEWLTGLDNGRPGCGATNNCPRLWVSPAFMSTREGSYDILNSLNVTTAGEQKLGIFPHWTVSNTTLGKSFSQLSLPVSEWYVGSSVAQALDYHTINSVNEAVDFYYDLGAFINLYGHNVSNDAGNIEAYLKRVLSKPRIWSTNAIGIYDWWVRRSSVTVTPTYWQDGGFDYASITIANAVDTQTAVEVNLPDWETWGEVDVEVFMNGILADSSSYRFTKSGLKFLVGTSVNQIDVRYRRVSTTLPIPGACLGEESGSFNIGITSGWSYRQSLLVQNPGSDSLPMGYTANVTINTADLVNAGKMRIDGDDLRIIWVNGEMLVELDRLAETAFNQTATEISFKLQESIAANSSDGSYFLYYGNPNAGAPPEDPDNVYALWDSFDAGVLDPGTWVSSGNYSISDGQIYLAPGTFILSNQSVKDARVEVRAVLESDHDFAWWGLEQNPNNSSNFVVFEETSDTFWAWSRNNGSDTSRAISRPAGGLTTWHTYDIDWYRNSVTWRIDDSVSASISTGGPLTGLLASIYAYSVPLRVDWVKVKLLSEQEAFVSLYPGNSNPTSTPMATSTVPLPTVTNTPTVTHTPSLPASTNTPHPPTVTSTAVLPTATNTQLPPTATYTPTPTYTTIPVLPTATLTPTSTFVPTSICTGEESGSFTIGSESGWNYRNRIQISNLSADSLPAGYALHVSLNTADLVASGKLRTDGNDFRVVWQNGNSFVQIDRVAETPFNSSSTDIWFRTQAQILGNGIDGSYFIYFGNANAGIPPANPANVYTIWDDFTGSTLNNLLWQTNYGSPSVTDGMLAIPIGSNVFGQSPLSYSQVEMRVRMGTADQYAWWGLEEDPLNGQNFIVFEETDQAFYAWSRANWSDSFSTLTDPAGSLSTWHTYTIRWLPGNINWQIDGSRVANSVSMIPTVGMHPSFYGYGASLLVDWVKVRPLAAMEPEAFVCPTIILTPTDTLTATPTPTNTSVPPTITLSPTNTPVPSTVTPLPTNTPVPPTATPLPTNTPIPPTLTPSPTNTPIPPTATPSPTNTPVPPTATPLPTNTSIPPTATSLPTNTPIPPTVTPLPTNTPVPPTATPLPTNTSIPSTATSLPTNTPIPPTVTPLPTHTPIPPTLTPLPTITPIPPTATPSQTHTPIPPTLTPSPTNTPIPPTLTPSPTHTPIPPTLTPSPTNTPIPPTATPSQTHTPIPPTATPSPTNTPIPPTLTPSPTHTPIPPTLTPSPTNTQIPPTATPTSLPILFSDGFESGDLTFWDGNVNDGGDLSVTAPGIEGNYALRAVIDNNTAIYLTDDTPLSETHYRAKFLFDPNSIRMKSGNSHYLFYGYTGNDIIVLRIEFRFYNNVYQMRANIRNDSLTWFNTEWLNISNASHSINLDWYASTAVNARNGQINLSVDGVLESSLTAVDNDTRRIDRIRIGAVNGLDTATRGTYYFDSFESYR